MIFHETSQYQPHTPDSAISEALDWLRLSPSGYVHVVLLTLPGRLRKAEEEALLGDIYRVLDPDIGSLFVWGQVSELRFAGFDYVVIGGDLVHAWPGYDRPALDPEVHVPYLGQLSKEFPPQAVEYCVLATGERPGRFLIDIFPRAQHLSVRIGASIGAHVLSVAPVSDLYTAHPTATAVVPSWVKDSIFHDDFFNRLKKKGECLLYPCEPHRSGYGRLRIYGKEWYSHHVSWMLSHRRVIPQGVPILHASCPDRRCCHPSHLRLGSTANNLAERWVGRRVSR